MNARLKHLLHASCLLICTGFGSQVGASIVGVDFGPPASSTPANWNLVTGTGAFTDLINEMGDSTDIALSVAGLDIDNFDVSILASTIPTHSTSLANLTGSIFTFEDRVDLAFTGLKPRARYDVWVFGVRDIEGRAGPAFEQTVNINGSSFVQIGADRELVVNGQVAAAGVSLDNYSISVRANASGEILIAVVDPGILNRLGGGVYLAGVALRPSLDPNPVPASPLWSLLLLGGLMTLVARRARRTSR